MTKKTKPVGMDEIASGLGVSKTTVHYALRNTGRVSSAMRERIHSMAERLGYRPNGAARSLRTRRTGTLGVVLGNLASSFHAHVLEGIDQTAQDHQHAILLACSYALPEREHQLIETLLEKGVDGLIVSPADPEANRDYYRRLLREGIKLVFINREVPGLNVDVVSTDNRTGGYLAVRHLLQQGRKKIVCVTTISQKCRSTAIQGRLAGANLASQETGLPSALVLGPNVPDAPVEEEFAYNAVREQLAGTSPPFDGLFAMHDGLAYGAIRALLDAGLRVPEDVAVVGFDDQDPSPYFQPPLTTVRQPMREIGVEAVRLLFRHLSKSKQLSAPQRLVLEPKLIVRRSSDSLQR